jgi:hypothetical protein
VWFAAPSRKRPRNEARRPASATSVAAGSAVRKGTANAAVGRMHGDLVRRLRRFGTQAPSRIGERMANTRLNARGVRLAGYGPSGARATRALPSPTR